MQSVSGDPWKAARDGDLEHLRYSLGLRDTNIGNPNPDPRDAYGRSPLHYAAVYGHLQCVEWLLSVRAKVDATAGMGSSPLHMCSSSGYTDVALALLRAHASVDIVNTYGNTPLFLAIRCNKPDSGIALLNHGANLKLVSKVEIPKWAQEHALLLQQRVQRCTTVAVCVLGVRKLRQPQHLIGVPKDVVRIIVAMVWNTRRSLVWGSKEELSMLHPDGHVENHNSANSTELIGELKNVKKPRLDCDDMDAQLELE